MTLEDDLDYYEPDETQPEFHARISYTLGELIEDGGIDWADPTWHWDSYNDEQYQRVCKKIENHYYDREISVIPISRWKRHLLRIINEIMPSLKPLYKAIELNPDIILADSNTYHKARTVLSDFPASQLSEEQDYASSATDNQSETVTNGNFLEKAAIIEKKFTDIDMIIIRKINTCFSTIISPITNAY